MGIAPQGNFDIIIHQIILQFVSMNESGMQFITFGDSMQVLVSVGVFWVYLRKEENLLLIIFCLQYNALCTIVLVF